MTASARDHSGFKMFQSLYGLYVNTNIYNILHVTLYLPRHVVIMFWSGRLVQGNHMACLQSPYRTATTQRLNPTKYAETISPRICPMSNLWCRPLLALIRRQKVPTLPLMWPTTKSLFTCHFSHYVLYNIHKVYKNQRFL